MSFFLPLHIAGIGRYLPERIVYNAEVEDLCHLCDGEIDQSGAGVRERRWVTEETSVEPHGSQSQRPVNRRGRRGSRGKAVEMGRTLSRTG